jgi:hypothetical protein
LEWRPRPTPGCSAIEEEKVEDEEEEKKEIMFVLNSEVLHNKRKNI